LFLLGVSPCEVLVLISSFPTSPSSSKKESICIFYRVFEFGGFTGSFLWRVLTSPDLIFYLLIILGIYVVHWIDIFLSFSKSPSLLKSESGCESYRIFREAFFLPVPNSVWTGNSTGNQSKSSRTIFFYFWFWLGLNQKFN
jgi:hypothetical protein